MLQQLLLLLPLLLLLLPLLLLLSLFLLFRHESARKMITRFGDEKCSSLEEAHVRESDLAGARHALVMHSAHPD